MLTLTLPALAAIPVPLPPAPTAAPCSLPPAAERDNHIQDDDDSSGWNGVIFLDGKGQVYGTSVTLQHDFTVPNGDTLEIRQDQTLSLAPDTTMTIYNEDCLTGAGTLDNGGGTYQILNPLPVFTPTTWFTPAATSPIVCH